MPQDHVAAGLVVDHVPDPLKSTDSILPRYGWKLAQSSTVSSQIAGGTGSLCLRKLSK